MTQYKITPQPGYAVVRPISADDFNKTELATLENEREHISTGEVLAVSEYAGSYENFGFQVSTDVKEKDVIAYIQYSEHPVKINGEELHLVRWDKIIATIEESK